jgi:hypothetical protein
VRARRSVWLQRLHQVELDSQWRGRRAERQDVLLDIFRLRGEGGDTRNAEQLCVKRGERW